ncbi:MAG: ectonucleotide pyrophosphatase/phosphodiesterase [Candidatus Acidiferrales bacterium]
MNARILKTFSGILAALVFLFSVPALPTHSQSQAPQQAPPRTNAAAQFPAASPLPIITVDHGPNAAARQDAPYVILVSLDGFRYDYPEKYGAPNLVALGKRGASAPQGMIPAYPSSTFPNHIAIITGLYPEHHGIVANNFYDPARNDRYAYTDPAKSGDGSWYSGVPLWSLAEQQGMRSACFFWPASDAEIAGERPSFYLHYDSHIPNDRRVSQAIAWLHLPEAQRPHFITLYFSDVDGAGHEFGPDSKETGDAVHLVDGIVGNLEAELSKLPLRIDLIVVADHGMEKVEGDWIDLDRYADLSDFETSGPLLYPKSEEAAEKAYEKLRGASDKFTVYRRSNVPPELHYDSNPRIGDPVVIANGPYWIRAHASGSPDTPPSSKGQHGYDPFHMITMRAIFYAAGPDIRPGVTLEPFENVNIYPLIAKILGLQTGEIDGNLKVLQGVLRTKPHAAAAASKN